MGHEVDHLTYTQETFNAVADTDLSLEQARDCIANVSGFFNVLVEWEEGEHVNTGRRNVPHTI